MAAKARAIDVEEGVALRVTLHWMRRDWSADSPSSWMGWKEEERRCANLFVFYAVCIPACRAAEASRWVRVREPVRFTCVSTSAGREIQTEQTCW